MSERTTDLPPIVCISSIDWDFLWQRHQILMSGFAQRGSLVAFVEKLDAGRALRGGDWRRLARRVKNVGRQLRAGDRLVGGVRIVTPPVLPTAWTRVFNRRVVLRRLARRLETLGFGAPLVWTYSCGPNARALEEYLRPSFLVYDCVNRVRGYKHATPEMIAAEDDLVRRADLVIADAALLWEEKRALNPRCVRLPPGTDYELFAPVGDWREPRGLVGLARPRLGFFGAIDDRLDQETLGRFADAHPSWSVVLIGPAKVDVPIARACRNVVMVPPVAYGELGTWLQGLDVLTIPYRAGEFTRGIIPAKLFETLASGKPVVAMGLPELEPFRDVIYLCDPGGFAECVEQALATDSADARAKRMDLARANSWASRVQQAWEALVQGWNAKGRRSERLVSLAGAEEGAQRNAQG